MNAPRPLLAPAVTILLTLAATLPATAAERDPRAVELAHRTMDAMGGEEAFAAGRLLRFDFVVERDGEEIARYRHWWDRHTGDYRLEGTDRESGLPFRVLFDVDGREGRAWLGGEELAGGELEAMLERAYGRYINDSYWLLMPWKWLDPGVRLAWIGERTLDGATYDVVELTFGDDVGLTSNDRYRAFVARDSGLMERWEYVLQQEDGSPGEGEPTAWSWEGWEATPAGVELSTVKRRLGGEGEVAILFPVATLHAEVDPATLQAALHPEPDAPEGR